MTTRKWIEYRIYDGGVLLNSGRELGLMLHHMWEFHYVPTNPLRIVAVEIIETVEEVAEVEGVEVRFMSAEEERARRAHLSALIEGLMR